MVGLPKHEVEISLKVFDAGNCPCPDVGLDLFQVHGFLDDLVVAWSIGLRRESNIMSRSVFFSGLCGILQCQARQSAYSSDWSVEDRPVLVSKNFLMKLVHLRFELSRSCLWVSRGRRASLA